MSKTISTNTGMLQLVDVGTYQGVCNPDNLIDGWRLEEELNEGYFEKVGLKSIDDFWFNFDSKKYDAWLVKKATEFIDNRVVDEIKELDLGIIGINVTGIWSPKEYNYDTDRLLFDLVVEDDFEDRLVKVIGSLTEEEATELSKYLKDNFTSCSGFISYVPNNINGLVKGIADEDERCISIFLQWYFYLKLDIYNTSWGVDDDMAEWYQFIQETDCGFYSFLRESILLQE